MRPMALSFSTLNGLACKLETNKGQITCRWRWLHSDATYFCYLVCLRQKKRHVILFLTCHIDGVFNAQVCKIVEGQRYSKRLNERQITALLKVTCQRPQERERDILQVCHICPICRD